MCVCVCETDGQHYSSVMTRVGLSDGQKHEKTKWKKQQMNPNKNILVSDGGT